MSIELLLLERTQSIDSQELLVRQLAETARALFPENRYHAFPATHSEPPSPFGLPDQLDQIYGNEVASLADMGLTPEEYFNVVGGTGFRYQKPDRTLGYFIDFFFRATAVLQDDIDYMLSQFGEVVAIGDMLQFQKTIDYEGVMFDKDWYTVKDEGVVL